mmetsp:Transcript_3641/g.12769  ORF Transcript_3641/g.12769 Transcript_3641/m.12769 type:complete len:98 (-) Transcript_3641:1876-2169(-)
MRIHSTMLQPEPLRLPSKSSLLAWYFLTPGLWAIDKKLIPESTRIWYSFSSPSALTALVHSSSTAYFGLWHSSLAMATLCFSPPDRVSSQLTLESRL